MASDRISRNPFDTQRANTAEKWLHKTDTYLQKTNKWLSANENLTGGLINFVGMFAANQEKKANIVQANIDAEYAKRDAYLQQAEATRALTRLNREVNNDIARRQRKTIRSMHEIENAAQQGEGNIPPISNELRKADLRRNLQAARAKFDFYSGNTQRITNALDFHKREERIKAREAELAAREKNLGVS